MVHDTIPEKGKGAPAENTLVVFRHGSTALNGESDERFRAWAEVPLSEQGKKEVLSSAKKLKGSGIDGIITSDLGRCVETAKILSKEIGAPILEESKGLRPWHLGELTGKPVKPNLDVLKAYINNPSQKVPEGESFDSFKKRMIEDVLRIQKKYPKDKICIVTHHRGERLIESWIKAGKPEDPKELSAEPFMIKGIKPGTFTSHEIPAKES